MAGQRVLVCILFLAAGVSRAGDKPPADPDPNRFAQEIKAFAEWDSKNAVPANPVLFVGSSSIRLWRTHESFPDLPVINRGFGGSQISDVIHFADRIVLPYQAKVIVFFAGGNDIAAGKSAQRVFDDYRRFVRLVHASQPAVRVVFLAINPSQSRWSFWPEVKKVNGLVEEFCQGDPRLVFADFSASFLDADGTPNSSLFLEDQLHLNAEGYAVWTKALAPILQKVLASSPPAGGKP
ncbi:MAG: GDSL-type esterase/lipase family protein [Phycisphaerae bacterium]|nr:GDSL-type esterase/lipase family protein [Phycisphaerae bacterium]